MSFIIGSLVVAICTIGGYALMGGSLAVLGAALPMEMVVIGGTAIGGFIIANPSVVRKRAGAGFKRLFKKPRYDKSSYVELLCLLYQVFKLARTKGLLALEKHVETPYDSSLFQQFPGFLRNREAVSFLCDYLRLITLGADKPYELEALMEEELEVHHAEGEGVVAAVTTVADSLPAIGIVAAVLGVIKTMGAINEPPEILGKMIGGALVGTFLGVWSAYGFVGPISNFLRASYAAEGRYMDCIKIALVAHLHGFAPSISVEYARKAILHEIRPTFVELEEATTSLPAVSL
ncbi:MAG: flagellar motor stator protein MotA [Alphaproteobacteria bacterium]|nr:flagellar motor stator protein MotA [Alphaproteobacteria bacterium]MCL2505829.1 flagellar motor stator protein MotA [Alphaproteobacteria bacterium]